MPRPSSSTRTSASFEIAAKRLSADVVNFAASGSSVEKGESLKDTILTLGAHKPDAIVIRAPWAGAPALVAGWTPAAIINAGDGKHEHPTQALLDVHTLRARLGDLAIQQRTNQPARPRGSGVGLRPTDEAVAVCATGSASTARTPGCAPSFRSTTAFSEA